MRCWCCLRKVNHDEEEMKQLDDYWVICKECLEDIKYYQEVCDDVQEATEE